MHHIAKSGIRFAVTLLMVSAAAWGARWLWIRYNLDPWTRDGRIRAEVVLVSPDVNGLVQSVNVRDGQAVRVGDLLFTIDRARYALALAQADALVEADEAQLAQAQRESRRNRSLDLLVTTEQSEETNAKVLSQRAQLDAARAARDTARLNLERTAVRSTVNGTVSNLELQVGNYAAAGRQVLALVNTDTIYVDGYFEETKLPEIRVGDRALVHIMGVDADLHGTVQSIAAGIEDRERGASGNSLANINPTFSWVRLAQRIPVRIALTQVPVGIRLIAGRTASVTILPPQDRRREGAR